MKIYLFTLLSLIYSLILLGQNNDTWISFYNKDSTLIGYKDKNNFVKIEPKFTYFTKAKKFENIIAVSENIDGKWNSYYLTKSGKTIGKNSLYIFDNSFDCESEGHIRFKDNIADKIGMYNKIGEIVIPAIYDALTNVQNGMIVGLKDAKKTYWDEDNHSDCNHFSWTAGQEVLIDTNNTVLVENFKYDTPLNFFTIEKTKTPHSDTIRESFLAKDGNYYSFVNLEKEFNQWIKKELLNNLTPEKLISNSYDTIIWSTLNEWNKSPKEKFIRDNYSIIKNGLLEILHSKTEYTISIDAPPSYIIKGDKFEKYYDNCGESKKSIYPMISIIITHKENNNFSQNHYNFLRTDNGYKLIGLTIRNEKLR